VFNFFWSICIILYLVGNSVNLCQYGEGFLLVKFKLATSHVELVAMLESNKNNVELRLYEASMEMKKWKIERAKELKLRILELQLQFGQGGNCSFTNGQEQ
jgi:hypothetical protein